MGVLTTIYDPNAGGDVVANVQLSDTELLIFNERGKLLRRWPYEAIAHAFAAREKMDRVLIKGGDSDIRLTIRNQSLYATLAARAPQLRPPRHRFRGWDGVPNAAKAGVVLGGLFLLSVIWKELSSLFH